MKFKLLIYILVFIGLNSYSQNKVFTLKGTIKNSPYQKVYLQNIKGDFIKIIDSTLVKNDCFQFNIKENSPIGMYTIVLNKKNHSFITVIFNNENIAFRSVFGHLLDSMIFIESKENILYYDNVKTIANTGKKNELLNSLLKQYDENNPFTKEIKKQIADIFYFQNKHIEDLMSKNPNTFFSKYLTANEQTIIPENIKENRIEYIKIHYFDKFDFNYIPLIYTDLVPNIIKNYLTFYESKTLSQLEQEQQYIKAVDLIITKSTINKEMNDFFTHQLLNYFSYGDYDIIGVYINETYLLKDQCESEGNKERIEIKEKIEKIRRVSIGKKAPEIAMINPVGKTLKLYDIHKEFIILVFWATWCPHCTSMLPDLKKIYNSLKSSSVEVLAIATDTDEAKWKKFVNEGNYNWINYCDAKGSNSPIFKDFNIIGTPTFFVLDKTKTIISKPTDLTELTQKLISLSLIK